MPRRSYGSRGRGGSGFRPARQWSGSDVVLGVDPAPQKVTLLASPSATATNPTVQDIPPDVTVLRVRGEVWPTLLQADPAVATSIRMGIRVTDITDPETVPVGADLNEEWMWLRSIVVPAASTGLWTWDLNLSTVDVMAKRRLEQSQELRLEVLTTDLPVQVVLRVLWQWSRRPR